MGGTVDIDVRYTGSSNFKESFLSFNDFINTIYSMEVDNRIPIGIFSTDPNNYTNYNGYNPIFKPGGFQDLIKVRDQAPDDLCCIYDLRYAWVDNNDQLHEIGNINRHLFTCDPRTIQVGFSSICDTPMYNACINNSNINSDYFKYKCGVWLNGLYKRFITDFPIINRLNNELYTRCVNNLLDPICKLWLEAIRDSGNPDYFRIADNVLIGQNDKSNLKCAFSPNYITQSAIRLNTPKECWYRECAFTPNYLLLTENITLKNNCSLSECNISIRDLSILNTTDITLTCNNISSSITSSRERVNIIINESQDYRFLLTDNSIIIILIFIFISLVLLRNN